MALFETNYVTCVSRKDSFPPKKNLNLILNEPRIWMNPSWFLWLESILQSLDSNEQPKKLVVYDFHKE